jgi:hypothetical protein
MILITFGWNIPSIKVQHEFGHQSYKKLLAINLLFITVFITQKNSKLYSFLNNYVKGIGAEAIPQYREQIKLIKSKARKQAYEDMKTQLKHANEDRDRYYNDYIKLNSKVSGLKNLAYQVRNIKALTDEELKNI